MTAESFASFITTYRRPETLRTTLAAVLDQTAPPELVMVVDNENSPVTRALVEDLRDDRVVYEAPDRNLGSAGGAAYGLERLSARGFRWMHLVDDDDPPLTTDTLERLRNLISRHDDGTLGAVAVNGVLWDWDRGEICRLADDELTGDIEVEAVGGNAQLTVCRDVVEQFGVPDPELFFGFWDHLYTLGIREAGWRIMIDGSLLHDYRIELGRTGRTMTRSLQPRDRYETLWRRYYVTRNVIHRMRTVFDRPDLARRQALKAIARSMGAWTRGPRYGWRYTRLVTRGIVDGYRNRLGQRVVAPAKPAKSNP